MFILVLSKALNIVLCAHNVSIMVRTGMATRLYGRYVQFLDSFATLRNATSSSVISLHPSVHPRGITRFPLERFS
jgi:hypothetical protein